MVYTHQCNRGGSVFFHFFLLFLQELASWCGRGNGKLFLIVMSKCQLRWKNCHLGFRICPWTLFQWHSGSSVASDSEYFMNPRGNYVNYEITMMVLHPLASSSNPTIQWGIYFIWHRCTTWSWLNVIKANKCFCVACFRALMWRTSRRHTFSMKVNLVNTPYLSSTWFRSHFPVWLLVKLHLTPLILNSIHSCLQGNKL